MSDVTITIKRNGPYVVSGRPLLVDHDGTAYPIDRDTIALCRCGQSANRPFCDGTHTRVGFVGEESAPTSP